MDVPELLSGAASSPCALVSLGLFLAETKNASRNRAARLAANDGWSIALICTGADLVAVRALFALPRR